jgi:trigger factor
MTILSYDEVSSSKRVFDIEVPTDEVEKALQKVTRNYARKVTIPGFRKGKVPETVVARRFADQIREDVLERLIPEALTEAIREKGIEPLGQPRIENLRFEEGRPLAFRANVDVRPPVDPGTYAGIEVADVAVEPSDEEIERTIGRLRESHAEFLPIEGRAAADGDYAIVDIAYRFLETGAPVLYTGSGEAIPEEKASDWIRDEKLTLEVGHPENMAEINEALRGISPGEKRTFRKTFAPDFQNEKFRGKTVDYEVSAAALKQKTLPEVDDEFARHLGGIETVSALRDRIAQEVRTDKAAARRRKLRRDILDALLSRTEIAAPEVLVEAETESALEDYASYLSSRGVDAKGADWDKLAAEARPGAERRVREYLLLDEIARREGLEVSETEVDAEIRRSAQRRGVDFGELRDRLVQQRRLGSVREEIRLNKAIDWLIERAALQPPAVEAK